MTSENLPLHVLPPIDAPVSIRRRKWRMFKDRLATLGMTSGGIGVIIAIMLIFFYLFYEVYPLLVPAGMEKRAEFVLPKPEAGDTLALDLDDKGAVGARLTAQGRMLFFRTEDGRMLAEHALPVPEGAAISSFAAGVVGAGRFVLGLADGRALVVKRAYKVSYPNDVRTVTPELSYPFGETPIVIDEQGAALTHLAMQSDDNALTIVALSADKRLIVASFAKQESFLDDSVTLERSGGVLQLDEQDYNEVLLDRDQRTLYLADQAGYVSQYDVRDKTRPKLVQRVQLAKTGGRVTRLHMLNGGVSLIVGHSDGSLSQWFPVRNAQNVGVLTHIRDFHAQRAAITAIVPEERRKGFIAADAAGGVGIYHTTAEKSLLVEPASAVAVPHLALSAPAETLLLQDAGGKLQVWDVRNPHPEISWSALWSKVWYESYQEPAHVWQSSSASGDFEPKFSLTPLTFGTLKAAFYAMLISIPLAVLGGIYTAYFMAPAMRAYVKPGIEIMAALPTVILGFLGGLWLAPLVEKSLPGVFSLLLVLPIGILLFTYFWYKLPKRYTHWAGDAWAAGLLIPVVGLLVWAAFAWSYPLELWLFDGNMRNWLNTTLGVDYDQRNAMIVGIVMGFAVIPTIFSITEDAVFSVPKHLTVGSLALGATPWQTMTRIVILTASPGIFSAVMIGMGRAVGETMIVLMATGNTPVMDLSLFQGMRTLSANIAVEMPESELGSTHYRILCLSALVLFLFTFIVNTVAEVVRYRLRARYGNL